MGLHGLFVLSGRMWSLFAAASKDMGKAMRECFDSQGLMGNL